MLAILIFIVILGVLVFVHELGHFITARRNGIKADEFGFGFPPRIVGLQFLYGKEEKKVMEADSVEVETIDLKNGGAEIRKRTITEKMHEVIKMVATKKWRLIWGAKDGDAQEEKEDLAEAHEKRMAGGTIYSLNWIPLGGFVKIKGEDGSAKIDADSFAGKPAWTRIKVLAAGVMMNFVLAWFLISLVFMLGAPQPVDSETQNFSDSKIQISGISFGSPAEISGLRIGDEILRAQAERGEEINISDIKALQDYIGANSGREINLDIKRGKEFLEIKVVPRVNAPEGQGPLGVTLAETAIIKYPWYQAFWEGLKSTIGLIGAILVALGGILKSLFMGQGVGADVAGPVGIAVLTKEVAGLGFIYILQFAALLSINLGIINILPIPALDGGRILFVLIEKIKGSPVSQKVEQAFHSVGFLLLILLLVLITFRDVWKFVK